MEEPIYNPLTDKWWNSSNGQTLIIEKLGNKIIIKNSKLENEKKLNFNNYYITSYDSINHSFSLVKPWFISYYLKKGKNRLPKNWQWSLPPPKFKEKRCLCIKILDNDSISCLLKMQPEIFEGFVYKSKGIICHWGKEKK